MVNIELTPWSPAFPAAVISMASHTYPTVLMVIWLKIIGEIAKPPVRAKESPPFATGVKLGRKPPCKDGSKPI
jgi:hypothetical protein